LRWVLYAVLFAVFRILLLPIGNFLGMERCWQLACHTFNANAQPSRKWQSCRCRR